MSILRYIENCIDSHAISHNTVYLILDDFNCHNSKWFPADTDDCYAKTMNEFCDIYAFSQIVSSATRFPDGVIGQPALLDIFLTSSPDLFSIPVVDPPVGTSDHAAVTTSIPSLENGTADPDLYKTETVNEAHPNFSAVSDWSVITDAVANIDWDYFYQIANPSSACTYLTDSRRWLHFLTSPTHLVVFLTMHYGHYYLPLAFVVIFMRGSLNTCATDHSGLALTDNSQPHLASPVVFHREAFWPPHYF